MFSETEARQFAHDWVLAWNSHDLDAVMSHYAPEVVLISPAAAKLLNDPSGIVAGKEAVRCYFDLGTKPGIFPGHNAARNCVAFQA